MRCELGILKSVKLEIQNFPKYVKSTNLSHITFSYETVTATVNFTIWMDLFVTDFYIDCWHSSKFKLKLIKRVELFVVLYGFYKMSSSTINLQLHPPCPPAVCKTSFEFANFSQFHCWTCPTQDCNNGSRHELHTFIAWDHSSCTAPPLLIDHWHITEQRSIK